VTAGEDRHQGILDHPLLAENDGGDRFPRRSNLAGDLFGRADDDVLEFFDTFGASHFVLLCLNFCRCGGFGIRVSIAASPHSQCQIQNRIKNLNLLLSPALTFVKAVVAARYECQNRNTGNAADRVVMP